MVYAALAPFEESTQSPPGGVKQRRARPAANLCAQLGLEASQQGLGRIGGKLAGHIGENRFVVGAADDGRSKCQSILCREYLRPGEPRIGKRPPSVRWGHSPKTKWYHIDCCFASFKRTCKKSKTITSVDDIEGFASLDAATATRGAGKGRDIPDFEGSYLDRFPLVSADFWTSDHLSERSRSVDVFFWNARARNAHVEATLNHLFPRRSVALRRQRKRRAGDNAPPRRQPKTTLSAPAAAAVLGAAVVPAPPARRRRRRRRRALDDAAGDAAAPGGGAPDLLTLMAVASSAYDRIAPPAGRAVSDGSASGGSAARARGAPPLPSTTTSTPRRRRPSRARSRPPRVARVPFFPRRRGARPRAQVASLLAGARRDPADVAAAARRGALAFERAFDRALARHATPAAAALETAADSPL
ncbi:N-acylsphingosine amidohydrolase [Aureococcus anophagefferens]|nr:N-acylsphingosine amidohydrolase [Aureococcus anophagefferens]